MHTTITLERVGKWLKRGKAVLVKVMAAGKAKNSEPVTIGKHGRPVAVVVSVEEYERLKAGADGAANKDDGKQKSS